MHVPPCAIEVPSAQYPVEEFVTEGTEQLSLIVTVIVSDVDCPALSVQVKITSVHKSKQSPAVT